MSNETFENLISKAGAAWSRATHRSCIAAQASSSDVQAYTDETVANAAGFAAFNDAFMRQDVDGIMDAMSDDPIFDAPNPLPDGTCFKGKLFVRAAWMLVFAYGVKFEIEESFVTGDRGVLRWMASREVDGKTISVRGADVFHLKNGKVAAKLTYSKAESFLEISMPF